ncbi:hypothetical protein PAHAL_8G214300 [Panicum hallii]|uniref:Uncharacterized protein n=1 Tax=Panicum hallii TaxID=206008 RepID=A0A2T8I9U1_9POAL|nr:hypothetical protein PAHAL_8G214300 [Panicum hallii]
MSAEQKIDQVKKQRVSNMSDEKRAELNRKPRESYKRRKAQSAGVENVRAGGSDVDPLTDLNTAEEDADWLHRNESY